MLGFPAAMATSWADFVGVDPPSKVAQFLVAIPVAFCSSVPQSLVSVKVHGTKLE